MAISKTQRFEIFKRDGFMCQYCGRKPPQVILEIDHLISRKKEGKDIPENLITACFDCNRGKGTRDLEVAPELIKEKTKVIREKELQLREFYKYQEKIKKRIEADIDYLDEKWHVLSGETGEYVFNDQARMQIRHFLKSLGKFEIEEAMEIAWLKPHLRDRFVYMCGVIWNKIKGKEKNNG